MACAFSAIVQVVGRDGGVHFPADMVQVAREAKFLTKDGKIVVSRWCVGACRVLAETAPLVLGIHAWKELCHLSLDDVQAWMVVALRSHLDHLSWLFATQGKLLFAQRWREVRDGHGGPCCLARLVS